MSHLPALRFGLGALVPQQGLKSTCRHTSLVRIYTRHYMSCRHIQTTSQSSRSPPLAFAFDIDGVLIRGEEVIPAAKKALSFLRGENPLGQEIPFILLTNGGGVSEEARCQKLSEQLGFQINPEQYIQSHTVLKAVVDTYADSPILVLGGKRDTVRKVAEGYGFKKVYNTLDVLAWNPSVWPFHDLTAEERSSAKVVDFTQVPISAIFVFHDPRDWALDIQIICDVIQSGGVIGGPHVRCSERKPVDLVFCNPDLLWRSNFDRPRFGQGAFKVAFQTVFQSLTGSTYPSTQFGKPTTTTYLFAEAVLQQQSQKLWGHIGRQLPTVYMIGDNPESDIAGANAANWKSVLVQTGVYEPRLGPPSHKPTFEAVDVAEAVALAFDHELRAN